MPIECFTHITRLRGVTLDVAREMRVSGPGLTFTIDHGPELPIKSYAIEVPLDKLSEADQEWIQNRGR